jgi:hypothetical protein
MRRRVAWSGCVVVATLLAGAVDLYAQGRPRGAFRPGSIELDLGGLWQGGVPLGAVTAPLTPNQTSGGSFDLFDTSSRIVEAPGFEARVGVYLTRTLEIDGGLRYSRPQLETRISADFEEAAETTAVTSFSQYIFDVNAVIHLNRLRIGRAGTPFIFGGGGYLRELHDGRELVDTGQIYQGGGGVKFLFTQSARGLIRAVGLRADGRWCVRRGGVELESGERSRGYAAAGAALVIGF